MEKVSQELCKIRKVSGEWDTRLSTDEVADLDTFIKDLFNVGSSVPKIQRINSLLLKIAAKRLVFPRDEESEFVTSAWLDVRRFEILEILASHSALLDEYALFGVARELKVLFVWPSTSPWCTYCMIFDLPCVSCPFFLAADPPLKATLFTKRRMCWVPNGFWTPLAKAVSLPSAPPHTKDTVSVLKQTFAAYGRVNLPVKLANLATKKGD